MKYIIKKLFQFIASWSIKIKGLFVILILLTVGFGSAFQFLKTPESKNISRKIQKIGVKGLKSLGLFTPTVSEYQAEVGSESVFYDYNNDGYVSDADYPLLISEIEGDAGGEEFMETEPIETTGTEEYETESESDTTTSADEVALPSLRGFGSNEFNGAVTVNYPIDLPPGPGGLNPSLSLSYSSSNVDDMLTGVETKWRNSQDFSFQKQSGIVGLGWELGGFGYISRDTKGSLNNLSDDGFILSFAGGAANLVRESCDENLGCDVYSNWRTVPNLKIKVVRFGRCHTYYYDKGSTPLCRYHWEVTTGDGTKYTFGSSTQTTQWKTDKDPDAANLGDVEWYPLHDRYGLRAWFYNETKDGKYHALTYSWPLREVNTVYGEKAYLSYDFEYVKEDNTKPYYVSAIYPKELSYSRHIVSLEREPRNDYKTKEEDRNPQQPMRSTERLSKIKIQTQDKDQDYQTRAVYSLLYDYGYRVSDHPNASSGNFTEGRAVHSLLKGIKVENGNGEYLPYHSFSYGDNCAGFSGGCPLFSFYSDDENINEQVRTPNDFFLKKSENGFNGSVEYLYWSDSGGNALNVQYCKNDEITGYKVCETGHKNNIQRHRASGQIVYDGMGDSIKTALNYNTNVGLGFVEGFGIPAKYVGTNCCKADEDGNCKYGTPAGCKCPGDSITCTSNTSQPAWGCTNAATDCEWERHDNSCNCPSDLPKKYLETCVNPSDGERYYCSNSNNALCASDCTLDSGEPFSGYQFLGYPEVEVLVYEKNSTSSLSAKSKSYYYQAMSSSDNTCFKPSPVKGLTYKTEVYDVDKNEIRNISETKYRVRLGPMFGPWDGADAGSELDAKCSSYDLDTTVTSVFSTETVERIFVNGDQKLCTKATTDYRDFWTDSKGKLAYQYDAYLLPHITTDWGEVDCNNLSDKDDGTTPKWSFTDFTNANTTKWIYPMPKESWVSDSENGEKYSHSRIIYDAKSFGDSPDYGRVTKSQVLKDGQVYATSQFDYSSDKKYLLTKKIDPYSKVTNIEYENLYNIYPIITVQRLGSTNPVEFKTEIEYDFNTNDSSHPNYKGIYGVPVKTKDVNGAISTMVYDDWGRLTGVYLPGRSPSNNNTPNTYKKYYYFNEKEQTNCNDSTNCLVGLGNELGTSKGPKMMVKEGTLFEETSGLGKVSETFTYYNAIGQQVQTRALWYDGNYESPGLPIDEEGLKDILSSKEYNSLGQVEYESLSYVADPFKWSNKTSFDTRDISSSSEILKMNYLYDGLGRAVSTLYPDGTIESQVYDFDGNPLKTNTSDKNCSAREPNCAYRISLSNAFGQVIETQSKYYEGSNEINIKTNFKYHPVFGSLTETKDTKGNTISKIEYDKLGQKVKMWDIDMSPEMSGDSNSWRYEYDLVGNLKKQTDPRGVESVSEYDDLYRLKSSYVNGDKLLENTYDSCTNGKGNICKTVSFDIESNLKVTEITNEYDNKGRVTQTTKKLFNMPDPLINDKAFTTNFKYDEAGRIIETSYPNNSSLNISPETLYPQYNRAYLNGISSSKEIGNYVSDARYNRYGQLVYYKNPNGIENVFSYDDENMRLRNLSAEGANLSSEDELNLRYDYDPVGNILDIRDNSRPESSPFYLTQSFEYDPLYRLTAASGAYIADYSYDVLNNIQSKSEGDQIVTLDYAYDSGDYYHRPSSASINGEVSSFEYDTIGNLMEDYMNIYQYDDNNRLVSVLPKKVESPSPVCDPIQAPIELSPFGEQACGLEQISLTWGSVAGAIRYELRIDDLSNGWCTDPGVSCNIFTGDIVTNTTNPSYTLNLAAGHSYNWWVYAVNECEEWSLAAAIPETQPLLSNLCEVPTCTDSDSDGLNGGLDYYTKGVVNGGSCVDSTDYCTKTLFGTDSAELNEYYCDTNTQCLSTTYNCPNGCSDGACVQEQIETCLSTYGGKCVPDTYQCTPETNYGQLDCLVGEICVEGNATCSEPGTPGETIYEVVYSEHGKSCEETCTSQGYDRCESVGLNTDANDNYKNQSVTRWFFSTCQKVTTDCNTDLVRQTGKNCSDREAEWTQCKCAKTTTEPPVEPPIEPPVDPPVTCSETYSGKCVLDTLVCTPDTNYGRLDCLEGEICVEVNATCSEPQETCLGTHGGKCVPDAYQCTPSTSYGQLDCSGGEKCVVGNATCSEPVAPPGDQTFQIVFSEHGKTCAQTCIDQGYSGCESVGLNSDANDKYKNIAMTSFFGTVCRKSTSGCELKINKQQGKYCGDREAEWTQCRCTVPIGGLSSPETEPVTEPGSEEQPIAEPITEPIIETEPETCLGTHGGKCVSDALVCTPETNYGRLDCLENEICVDSTTTCSEPKETCSETYKGKCISKDYSCDPSTDYGQVDCDESEKCVEKDASCTAPQEPPAMSCVPDPKEPEDWGDVEKREVNFKWTDCHSDDDAKGYQILITGSDDFEFYSDALDADSSETFDGEKVGLEYDHDYYWRVRSCADKDCDEYSAWSIEYSFTWIPPRGYSCDKEKWSCSDDLDCYLEEGEDTSDCITDCTKCDGKHKECVQTTTEPEVGPRGRIIKEGETIQECKLLDGEGVDLCTDNNQCTGSPVMGAQTSADREIKFYYDALGQRIAKLDSDGDHIYYISPSMEVIFNYDGTLNWRKNYYFGSRFVAVREYLDSTESSSLEDSGTGSEILIQEEESPFGNL